MAKEVNIGRNTIKRSKEARKVFKSLKMLNGKELAVGFELDNSTNNDSTNALPKKYGLILKELKILLNKSENFRFGST